MRTCKLKCKVEQFCGFLVQVVTAVMWNKPDSQFSVPVWIIILAVLVGLLLLALLIYLLYKVPDTHTPRHTY